MIKNHKFFLLLFSLVIIILYVFFFFKNKGSIEVNQIDNNSIKTEKSSTIFKNVEYKSHDQKKREYITKANIAKIYSDQTNIINLFKVNSFTKLKDGTFLNLTSDEAVYFKDSKDIFYKKNVLITNIDKKITSNEAKYFYKKNLIELSGNVIMQDPTSKILGDIAKLNTINNDVEIIMLSKGDQVYGERRSTKKK